MTRNERWSYIHWRWGGPEPGHTEERRQGDQKTGRQGDKKTGRQLHKIVKKSIAVTQRSPERRKEEDAEPQE